MGCDPIFNEQAKIRIRPSPPNSGQEFPDAGRMRVDPTDISDVTGDVLTYLVNGHGPKTNWTALFAPGERVRLRFINAAAMTVFNVRIPGLSMQVVNADGQDVRPVAVDEFQFSPGETYDVIVTPSEDKAFTIVGESVDRSGMAVATLAPRAGMRGEVPPLRTRPVLTMKDMGMEMEGMDMKSMSMRDGTNSPQVKLGPGVEMINPMPMDRTGEPGIGLDKVDHKVLVYKDLVALQPNPDVRAAEREIEVHLTGAMDRYMWSMDGKTMSEAHEPLPMREGALAASADDLRREGATAIFVGIDGQAAGVIAIADPVKPTTPDALDALPGRGAGRPDRRTRTVAVRSWLSGRGGPVPWHGAGTGAVLCRDRAVGRSHGVEPGTPRAACRRTGACGDAWIRIWFVQSCRRDCLARSQPAGRGAVGSGWCAGHVPGRGWICTAGGADAHRLAQAVGAVGAIYCGPNETGLPRREGPLACSSCNLDQNLSATEAR